MNSNELRNTLSSNIKRFRNFRQYTQNELAARADLSVQTIIKIELGTLWPSDKTLCKIAEVFEIETYKLFIQSIWNV